MWLERRGDSEKYGPGDVSIMKPWSFPKLFKFLKSWLRAVCSPLCNYIASSLPNFPSPLINYGMHSLFFILLFLNNNKKTLGECLDLAAAGALFSPTWCDDGYRVQLPWSWWHLAGSFRETSGVCVTQDMFFWTKGKHVVLLSHLLKKNAL